MVRAGKPKAGCRATIAWRLGLPLLDGCLLDLSLAIQPGRDRGPSPMTMTKASHVPSRVPPWRSVVLAILAGCFLAFVAGAFVSEFHLFPYRLIFENAFAYLHAVQDRRAMEAEAQAEGTAAAKVTARVTIPASPDAFDGYTFLTFDVARPSTARLIDMNGNVLHEWHRSFRDIWPDHPQCQTPSPESAIAWRYAQLFPNGDIIASVTSYGDTPYGYGLVKLDKNSNVIWAVADNFHHQFSISADGTIYGLTHHWRILHDHPLRGDRHLPKRVLEDFVVEVSPQGKELASFSLLDAMAAPRYRALLDSAFINDYKAEAWDPLHANAIDFIPPDFAAHHAFMQPGMLLISMRELDALVVVDVTKRSVVWATRGAWIRQHDPELLSDGDILLFDNRGANLPQKGSRLIEFSPDSGHIDWSYAGTSLQPFRSDKSGGEQRLPNGNTLVSEDDNGRVFEVSRKGIIVWEYRDVRLHRATRVAKDWLQFVPSGLATPVPATQPQNH
jgi:hypothetical protein